MRNINLFVEDQAHEKFLVAILHRFSSKHNVPVKLKSISARGGRGKVISELKQYLNDLQRYKEPLPDLIIVATDSNCKGIRERENEIRIKEINETAHHDCYPRSGKPTTFHRLL